VQHYQGMLFVILSGGIHQFNNMLIKTKDHYQVINLVVCCKLTLSEIKLWLN
jgi:hypothetical protein